MTTMADILRELQGAGDTAWTMGKSIVKQPFAGYKGLQSLAHGKGLDQAVQDIEDVGAVEPATPEGARNLGAIGHAVESVGNALGNPVDKLGELSPLLGAGAAGFIEVADPSKVAGKAARAAKAAARAADPLRGFGTAKLAREASTAKRALTEPEVPVERQKGAGGRAKVDPAVFRKQYEAAGSPEAGYQSVLASALRGEHLKPQPAGGWAGAPRTVQTGPQLGGMRRGLDDQFNRGVDALQYADPERVGTWYDRAKAGNAEISEPHQLDRGLEETAVYSAGVSPENELAFRLKHGNSRALGTPEMAYRGAGMRTLDTAVEQDRPAKLAHKIGEYRSKNDPRIKEESPFGVNDFRMAQAFGYTDPKGNPWKAGATETMHPFMDAETTLAVQRARARQAGGKDDWTGATLQEIPWVLNKAEDIYGRGKKGRYAGGREGMVSALRDANNTLANYLPKHAASSTYEYKTGANVGHLGEESGAPGYGAQGAWATPSPMAAPVDAPTVGAGNRDALYRAAGLRQQPTLEGVGQYTNSAGEVENNALHIARPLMDFSTDTAQQINPNTLKSMKAIEGMRGTIDAQEASAMNLPVTMGGRTGKSSMLLERGTLPNADELKALTAALRGTDHGVTPTNRGALVMNFGGKIPEGLEAAMPGSTPQKAAYEGIYEPGVSAATHAGQGKATARTLGRFAAAPEALAKNIGESDEVRSLIRAKMARDEALGGGRADIQATRKFFSEADWPKAVEMMRKGMKPAAALAAMGYSLKGMAAEEEQR